MDSLQRPSIPKSGLAKPDTKRHILLILIVSAIGCFYMIFAYRTFVLHYYPSPPLFYDEGDSLADWINTCAWSDRTDRYTAWQSLYTPFAHFLCTISNLVAPTLPPNDIMPLRQYNPSIKLILGFHTALWLAIFMPIKPFKRFAGAGKNFIDYMLGYFPFKLLTFLSFTALFSFERGNTLSVGFFLFLLSLRVIYNPVWREVLHPFLVGIAAAIKPYILMFTLYGRKFKSFIIATVVVAFLQIIPILLVGAPGIENLPANLDYFSNENSIYRIISKVIGTFSFRSFTDMKILIDYGVGRELLAVQWRVMLDFLYFLSISVFALIILLSLRCLMTSINIDRHESMLFSKSNSSEYNDRQYLAEIEWRNSRVALVRYAIPSFLLISLFLICSQSSGAYVALFLLAPIMLIEEETGIISRSPVLLSLYFGTFVAFDLPALTSKAYECGIRNVPIEIYRLIPLLSEQTGHQFLCLGIHIGPLAIARPFLLLVFICFFILKLTRLLKDTHQLFSQKSQLQETKLGRANPSSD